MLVLQRFWYEEDGVAYTMEIILFATIVTMALTVGLTAIRDAVVAEAADVASAFGTLNQSFEYYGIEGHSAGVAGAAWDDNLDHCDETVAQAGNFSNCVALEAATATGEDTAAGPNLGVDGT